MVRCVDCAAFSLREDKTVAKLGMGVCAHETLPSVRYVALLDKHCVTFKQAAREAVLARLEWLAKKGVTS